MKCLRPLFALVFVCLPLPAVEVGMGPLKSWVSTLSGEQREAADFLLESLPASDRTSLPLELFRENLEQAYQAREHYPWTKALPKDLFFNEVLPYAVVDETRDPWRKRLRELLDPEIRGASTLREACQIVSEKLPGLSGVEYSTAREKACQSPAESMRQGKASCTGLSILMVDAMRAVGIPARMAGIVLWGTLEGNHTWVEIHDGKSWRFSGFGSTPDQWDQGWEIERCAYSDPQQPIHSIFAVSYRSTPIGFPAVWSWVNKPGAPYREVRDATGKLTELTWTLQKDHLGGIDRTEHYLKLAGGRKYPIPEGKACVSVRVYLSGQSTRVDLPVRVRSGEQTYFDGRSASEVQDRNDYIRVIVPPGKATVEHQLASGEWKVQTVDATKGKETEVKIEVAPEEAAGIFSPEQRKRLASWFRTGGDWPDKADWPELKAAAAVDQAKAELWSIYRDIHHNDAASKELGPLPPKLADAQREGGLKPGVLNLGDHQMPFVLIRRETLPVPVTGRALYIAMHGGGANPQASGPHAWEVNDGEWQAQASLAAGVYAGEGIYFVPRMADDREGRWHLRYNQDAFDLVIGHALREWGVDPDRVYLMGISEGCYGTQILMPQMADRFAAGCAMAGGISEDMPLENLRNVAFRTEVGELDKTFDRVGLARRYHAALDEFAKTWGPYENVLNVQVGRGHGIDYSIGPKWMIQHHRDPRPKTVVWTAMSHDGRRRAASYWLGLEGAPADARLELRGRLTGEGVKLVATNPKGQDFPATLRLMLDDGMVDLSQTVKLTLNGRDLEIPVPGRHVEALARSLAQRGDPNYMFPAIVELRP